VGDFLSGETAAYLLCLLDTFIREWYIGTAPVTVLILQVDPAMPY
jgi:hypothetical protein